MNYENWKMHNLWYTNKNECVKKNKLLKKNYRYWSWSFISSFITVYDQNFQYCCLYQAN